MQTLQSITEELANRGAKKVVLVTGTFDILHVGHINFLKEAKSYGDILVVGVTGDELVKKLKGSDRLIIPEAQRAEIIAAIRYVDYVFIDGIKKSDIILKLVPDVVLISVGGFSQEQLDKVNEMVKRVGTILPNVKIIFSKDKNTSTTAIINKIRSVP